MTQMECLNCKHTEQAEAPLPEQCPTCGFYSYSTQKELDEYDDN